MLIVVLCTIVLCKQYFIARNLAMTFLTCVFDFISQNFCWAQFSYNIY